MSGLLLDTGMSPRGWSYYGDAGRCLHLFGLKRHAGYSDTGDPLTRGTMGHVTQGHLHMRWMLGQQGQDPDLYLPPEAALAEWCRRHPEGLPFYDRMLEVFRRWLAANPVPRTRILGVECLVVGMLGSVGGAWGLWVIAGGEQEPERWAAWHEGMPKPRCMDGREIEPSCLNMPGHPEHGRAILMTRRLDLIEEKLNGRVDIVDHKCLPSYAIVHDTQEGYTTVEQLREGWRASAFRAQHADIVEGWGSAPRFSGVRPVYTLALANGMRARLGDLHPVLTRRGWIEAARIVQGDHVAVALTLPTHEENRFPDALLTAAGSLVCDGDMVNPEVRYSKQQPSTFARYADALRLLGFVEGPDFVIAAYGPGRNQGARYLRMRKHSGERLLALLREAGFPSARSRERYLPNAFMALSQRQTRVLLGALWDGDGAAYLVKDAGALKVRIVYSCASERLARQIQSLLLKCGFPATFTTSSVAYCGERRATYTTTLVGAEGKRRFLQEVIDGALPVPALAAGEGLTRSKNPRPRAQEMLDVLRAEGPPKGGKRVETTGSAWWVKVTANAEGPREPVFEIEVSTHHTFVAEGLITHNCTAAEVSLGRVRKYAMDGQFAAARCFGEQLYPGRFDAAVLHLIGTESPYKIVKAPLKPSPWRDGRFAAQIYRLAHVIAQLERDVPNPHDWPMAQHELACAGRYGDCPMVDVCMLGPMARPPN